MNYDIDPIVVYTPCDYKQMKHLQRYAMRRIRYLFTALAVIFSLSYIYLYSSSETPMTMGMVLSVLSGAAPYLAFFILMIVFSSGVFYTKKRHEAATLFFQNGQTAYFRNSEFVLAYENDESKGTNTYSYSFIQKACETEKMFVIYINKNQVVMIDKEGFSNGTPEELRSLLLNNLPENKCKSLLS